MVVKVSLKKPKKNSPIIKKDQLNSNGVKEKKIEDDDVPDDIRIIAQEVQIVKSLACNDLAQRNRQLKKLRKWLQIRTKSSFKFNQEDFMRIWKGLYYNMWYSDKPLVQEEFAEQLGKLLECFGRNFLYSVDFFGAFLKTMCTEWFGIDQWRIDKFLMLTRRMLRYMFKLLKSLDWSLDAIELFNKHATETVLIENVSAKGLTMHYFDIFFEELAKVSEGNISADQVVVFVKPFAKFIATQKDIALVSHCRTRIFYHLLYQSALGREYTEKYNAWKCMGFPSKHIDDLEKMNEPENEENIGEKEKEVCTTNSEHLDPRAGNIDVFMPELPFDSQPIIREIEPYLHKEECPTKRRKLLKKILNLLKIYDNGEFPLGIKTMPRFEVQSGKPLIKEKIRQLESLENELYGVDRKLKQMTKRKRRKFLKSLNFDEIDENNYENAIEKALPKNYLKERRKRTQRSFMSSWLEEEIDEHDIKPKKLKKENAVNGNLFIENNQPKTNKFKLTNLVNNESKDIKDFKGKKTLINKTKTDSTQVLYNIKSKNIKNNTISNYDNQLTNKQVKDHLMPELKPKELKKESTLSDSHEEPIGESKKVNQWIEPLGDGEIEYFLPFRKLQLKKANADLVLNPLAKQRITDNQSTPVTNNIKSFSAANTPRTSNSIKRVKIALKHNTSQNPFEYIQQIKSSPNIPYDAKRKPGKGLLKPNAMPSPINPFYKKKIGLKLLNDTI